MDSDDMQTVDSRQSGSISQSRTHSRPEYGSRTSISQLPPLPTFKSATSEDEYSDPEDTNYSGFVEFHEKPNSPFPDHENIQEDVKQEASQLTQEEEFFNDNMASWKPIRTVTEEDYYNDEGKLEFHNEQDVINKNDVNWGYTRIDTAEQMAKYHELDKKTDFLFVKTSVDEEKTAKYRDDDKSDDESFIYEDENLETDDALESTKDMLSDNQKFSYVGIIRLITVDMAAELAKIKLTTSTKVAKQLSQGQKNFGNWSTYIMGKIYAHLDLTEEEQHMIEQLGIHGLEVEDLTLGLAAAERTPNFSLPWVLVCDLFLLLVSDGYYDSRSRALLMKFAGHLGIEKIEIFQFERRLLNSLELETKDKSLEDKEETLNDKKIVQKYIKKNKNKRLAYIGLATVGGTLAIGLSAGLLAPVIGAGLAAGLTTVGIGGTSGFLAGIGGTSIITTGGVVLGAKVGAKAGQRRAGDVKTFELKPLHNNKRSNLIITVSGWMTGKADDVRLPFSTVDPVMGDLFSVLWEPDMLKSMGQTIGILASEALTSSIQQILGATIMSSLMAALQVPLLLSKLTYLVDNPWNVSLDRAWKAGKILADTIVSGNLGVRPMTLIGFSLGSRVIYSCLIELAQRGCFGLIENVIILGAPITVNRDQLGLSRAVVSGRFINGYSRKDWVLGYLFRATGGGLASVAGLSPINNSYGLENIDVTEFVEGHMSYRKAIPKILEALEWEVLDAEFDEIEEPDTEEGERQRQLIHEFDEARAKMKQEMDQDKKPKKGWKGFFSKNRSGWWNDIDEPAEAKPNEDEYNENPTPIFDVGEIMKEAKEIERQVGSVEKTEVPDVPLTAAAKDELKE